MLKFHRMEAIGDMKQLERPEIAQYHNPTWPPGAILDFQNAMTFEPVNRLSYDGQISQDEAIADRNSSEWPEIVHHHDGAVPGLLLYPIWYLRPRLQRIVLLAVLGLLLLSE